MYFISFIKLPLWYFKIHFRLVERRKKVGIDVFNTVPFGAIFRAAIAAVAHDQFRGWPAEIWIDLVPNNGILFDLKGMIPRELGAKRL